MTSLAKTAGQREGSVGDAALVGALRGDHFGGVLPFDNSLPLSPVWVPETLARSAGTSKSKTSPKFSRSHIKCPVEGADEMSALQAVRVGDHVQHGRLLEDRHGAGNEDTGSNFAGDGEEDYMVAGGRESGL